MAMSTTQHILAHDAWVLVAEGPAHVLVQLRSNAAVLLHLGSEEPAGAAPALFLSGAHSAFTATGLTEADKIWARAAQPARRGAARVTVAMQEPE